MLKAHAVLLAALLLGGCATVPAGERGIVVTGTGRVLARPDTGLIDVGAEARAPQLADAREHVDRTMRDVLTRVRALGVNDADVRTTVYQIDPIAEPRQSGDEGARIIGYRVANVVQVRARNVDRLEPIAEAAVTAGANILRNIRFTIDDPSRFEAEARALAMREAATKAGQVAAAAGVRLGRLLSVRESSPVRPVPRMALQSSVAGPVESGELEVMVSVEARYGIEH
ncbi:MAG TPA: SIMPL domain-containing protein [Methylomirabilota bacterium]|jgi:hypothetical protein|nr:SIMPL domain-containing protein [Methylomirabilota bacterium]